MRIRTLAFAISTMGLFSFIGKVKALEVGAEAPRITAVDQNGDQIDFAGIYSKGPTLVFFYPKADTPGCTAQACSLRDAFESLEAKNLQILGVSRDSAEAQKKFQAHYKLPFPLIADKEGNVAEAFGVPAMGGVLPFSKRQSFLIQDGKIVWKAESAQTAEHAKEVQAALDSLK
ncbi:MAG: peroxiredoxin [Verrucomicrobiota bacterium]